MLTPPTAWNAITKIKLYTNASSQASVRISAANSETTFDLSGNYVSTGASWAGQYVTDSGIIDCFASNIVPGASLPSGTLTTNVGDPGTRYGELVYGAGSGVAGYSGLVRSAVGTVDEGIVSGQQKYYTNSISIQIDPGSPAANYTGFKFRCFIEYV